MEYALSRAIEKAREITNYQIMTRNEGRDIWVNYYKIGQASTPDFFLIKRSPIPHGQIDPAYAEFHPMECRFTAFSIDWRDTNKLINTLVALWCKCCDVKGLPYRLQHSYNLQSLGVTVTASCKLQDDKLVTNWQIVEKRLDDLLHALNL